MSEKQTWERYEDVARQLIDDIKSYLGVSMVNPDKKEFQKKDGGICEIDVSAYDMGDGKLVLVECRNRKKRLSQEEVHGFAYRIQQTNAKRGIIITPIGLQKGARIAADGARIGLVKLEPNSTPDNYIAQLTQLLIIKITDSFGGMSMIAGSSQVIHYPVPQTSEQVEKVKQRLKQKTNKTEFSTNEILEEFAKMQDDV